MRKTVIVCDRCGKEHKLSEWPRITFHSAPVIPVQLLVHLGNNSVDEKIDLCKECRESFVQWWDITPSEKEG